MPKFDRAHAVFIFVAPCLIITIAATMAVRTQARAALQTQKGGQAKADKSDQVFHEYKGVTLGMNAEEARKKLGTPTEQDDEQDFFIFSDTESAQVYYDKSHAVKALSINYVGDGAGTPKPKAVLGTDVQAKPDGSMHELIRFPKAGFWVSYSRTAGDSPLITVTVQKID